MPSTDTPKITIYGWSTSDVAAQLGWHDQSHFIRDFCRYLGVTPGQYTHDASHDR